MHDPRMIEMAMRLLHFGCLVIALVFALKILKFAMGW